MNRWPLVGLSGERNGAIMAMGIHRRKHWPTALGPLDSAWVPRCREAGWTTQRFARLEDHWAAFSEQVLATLLGGSSTRRVGERLDRIIQLPVSAGPVLCLAKKLEAQVQEFHRRPLADDCPYLIVDAVDLQTRGTPQ